MGYRWCPECQRNVRRLPEPVCIVCGKPIRRPGKCPECTHHLPQYKEMRSWLLYGGPIRSALHSLKYQNNLGLGEALAGRLAPFVDAQGWPIDIVVPVPLGKKRMKERGYNQVGLVAMPLASMNGWKYRPRAIARIQDSRSQVGLTPKERRDNVANSFLGDSRILEGKIVLLMDDITTTGATVNSCAGALVSAGANDVFVLTLARAVYQHGSEIA